MRAYKLFKLRRDGTLGSLFINKRAVIPIGIWCTAEAHRTKNYAYRPGWHAMGKPVAPHLSSEGRIWAEVSITNFVPFVRPDNQGGKWYLAQRMRVNRLLKGVNGYDAKKNNNKKVR